MIVGRLSHLANFLEEDSLPAWLKEAIGTQALAIRDHLAAGKPITLFGPRGESVTISPK